MVNGRRTAEFWAMDEHGADPTKIQRFKLVNDKDRVLAVGVEFTSHWVAMHWMDDPRRLITWRLLEELQKSAKAKDLKLLYVP